MKLVHIDGSHDYESVKADIEAALKLLVPGGVICGHDADAPGVRQVIAEVLGSENRMAYEKIVEGKMWNWKSD